MKGLLTDAARHNGIYTRQSRTADVRQIKAIARNDALAAIARLMISDRKAMDRIINDPNATAIQLMVASVISKTIKEGDASRLAFLLSYIIGKPSTYDPTPEDLNKDQRSALASVPSDTLIAALRAQNSSVSVPAPIPDRPIETVDLDARDVSEVHE